MRAALERDRAGEARRLDRDARRGRERRLARQRLPAAAPAAVPGPAAPAGGCRAAGAGCGPGRRAAAAAAAPAAAALLLLLLHLRAGRRRYCQPISTSADSTMARIVFFWSVIIAVSPRCAARARAAAPRRNRRRSSLERQRQRRAPSDQHIVMARRMAGCAPTASRSPAAAAAPGCARPQLPTFLDTVKPTRDRTPHRSRLRACSTNAAVGALIPAAAARKSARCVNRSMATAPVARRRQALSRLRPRARRAARPCGRPWSPCGRGSRDGACAPACSVDRSASRCDSPLVARRRKSHKGTRIEVRSAPGRFANRPDCTAATIPRLIGEAALARQLRAGAHCGRRGAFAHPIVAQMRGTRPGMHGPKPVITNGETGSPAGGDDGQFGASYKKVKRHSRCPPSARVDPQPPVEPRSVVPQHARFRDDDRQ